MTEISDGNPLFFSTYFFLENYIKNFSDKYNFKIILVYNNKTLVGYAPLYTTNRKKGPFSWTELRFASEGDFRGFVIRKPRNDADPSKEKIIQKIFEVINEIKWDRICLDYISSKNDLFKYIKVSNMLNPYLRFQLEAPYIELSSMNLEDIKSIFPSKLNKYKNKLEREVGYYFEVVNRLDDELFDEMASLHIEEKNYLKSKGREERHSLYEDDRRRRYFHDVLTGRDTYHCCIRKSSDSKLLAYRNVHISDDILHSWNTAYSPEVASYRVNNIILYEMIKYFKENNIDKVFSLGSGGYPWKFAITDKFVSLYTLDYFRNKKNIKKLIDFSSLIK